MCLSSVLLGRTLSFMRIEHIAIWVQDLEGMKSFYETYFNAISNDRYINPQKKFSSYFLSFENGCRLELMQREDVKTQGEEERLGLAHFAVSMGDKKSVDDLSLKLLNDGYEIVGQPRTTGDGYYESVIKDPEGNLVELTV